MLNFREWHEAVYRIDQDRIGDFSKNLRTYHRNSDWSSSGTFDTEAPPDWHKETGLFAGELKHVIPYATPRDVRWIIPRDGAKRPTVIFDVRDKAKIASYRPHLSQFPSSTFTKVPSGEFFSTDPQQPSRQEVIRNPLKFIQKWYNVQFTPDIVQLAKQMKSQKIGFDSEGI